MSVFDHLTVKVERLGNGFVANVWTEDGQHFTHTGRTGPSALFGAGLMTRSAEARTEPMLKQCKECRAAQGMNHETWCPSGPGAMYA